MTTSSGRFGRLSCATGVVAKESLEARRGDVLVVFSGCSVPILLRAAGKPEVFSVFGEAYVLGMMEGEIQGLLDSGEVEMRDILLQ